MAQDQVEYTLTASEYKLVTPSAVAEYTHQIISGQVYVRYTSGGESSDRPAATLKGNLWEGPAGEKLERIDTFAPSIASGYVWMRAASKCGAIVVIGDDA